MKHYKDYYWKEGIPQGLQPLAAKYEGSSYKIVTDPYRKHISIEKYQGKTLSRIIYDSAIFDFRNLKISEQIAWQKIPLEESKEKATSMIRDQNDRVILIETYTFENDRCTHCHASSPHGFPVSKQVVYLTTLGSPINGVILYDSDDHPVMMKRYAIEKTSEEFTEVLEENWNMQDLSIPGIS